MSPRRIRREAPSARPDPAERVETWPDGDWIVRPVAGAAAIKAYRCPGCDQEIPPGLPHLVAWRADALPVGLGGGGISERRHWHVACWQRRLHRRARPLR